MFGSIRKFSKSFLAKIFIAIIALPFLLWGMGDVFRSGKQNVLVEINDEKISSKEFVAYIQKIKLSKSEIERVGKSKIFDDILTNYISEKIIRIEGEKKGIQLTDVALKKILTETRNFQKDNKFSRIKYEKFLLENGYTAATYERYIKNIELKGQLLKYYSGGIKLPEFIIDELFIKENQIKNLEYINLSEIYKNKIIDENEIKKTYEENKDFFKERFISFRFLELKPEILTKQKELDELYYEELDKIENNLLDGNSFDSVVSGNELNIKKIDLINARSKKVDGSDVKDINKDFLQKIFQIKEISIPQFLNINNKYYIIELTEEKTISLNLNDKDLRKTLEAQLKIGYKINENKKIIDRINNKKFKKKEMIELSNKHNIQIKKIKINGITDKKTFTPKFLSEIYNHNAGEIFLFSDNIVQDNYLVSLEKDTNIKIDKKSAKYKQYFEKSNNEYISKVYKSYDRYINTNYKIDINQKVFERLKNSF